MTATLPPALPRTTEPVCPPWCAGHDDTFQPWEEVDDGSGYFRDHESKAVVITEGVSVATTVEEILDVAPSSFIPAKVRLNVDDIYAGVDLLTPRQAIALATALLNAADAVLDATGAAL